MTVLPDTALPIRQPGVEFPSLFSLAPAPPPLCPELSLLLSADIWSTWQTDTLAEDIQSPPPYWAVAWPGGQAIARYVLDNRRHVVGRKVLDCGSGSGLVAIAAAAAGAREVVAVDCDPSAVAAIEANAAINGVHGVIDAKWADLASMRLDDFDILLAGDLWYERFSAPRITARLRQIAASGIDVLIGDNARAYTPRRGVTILADYKLPADPRIESDHALSAYVAKLHGEISGT